MLEIVSILIGLLCVGVVVVMCNNNRKLIQDTRQAKHSYLGAKSKLLITEDDISEMHKTLQDTFKLNKELKVELIECEGIIREQAQVIREQKEMLSTYKSEMAELRRDNQLIKRKLNLYDELAPRCRLVEPVKTTL